MVVTRLQRLFDRAIEEDLRVLVQQRLIVDEFDEPQPDIVVLRQPLGSQKPESRDCLVVIEVSETTYDDDRYVKLPAYLHGGVPLVWIVNIREGLLEEYDRLPGPDELGGSRYLPGGNASVAGIRVDVKTLLEDLPTDDG